MILSYPQKLVTISLTSLVLISCSGETTRSVDWYLENSEQRTEVLRDCTNNLGEVQDTPNCQNASQARGIASAREMGFGDTW